MKKLDYSRFGTALNLIGIGAMAVKPQEARVADISEGLRERSPFGDALTAEQCHEAATLADAMMGDYITNTADTLMELFPNAEQRDDQLLLRLAAFSAFSKEVDTLGRRLHDCLSEVSSIALTEHHFTSGTMLDALSKAVERIVSGRSGGKTPEAQHLDDLYTEGKLEPLLYGSEALAAVTGGDPKPCDCDNCVEVRNRIRAGCPIYVLDNGAFWVGPADVNRAVGLN